MMNSISSGTINHEGVVQKVSNKSVTVSISSASACSGCHAEGSCSLSGKEEKIIEVSGRYNVKSGDTVTILMKQSMGYTAVFFGYILPLIPLLSVLIILISLNVTELVAGSAAFSILLPYYLIRYLFRKRINEKFTFTLKA